jgi:hypothetical protein
MHDLKKTIRIAVEKSYEVEAVVTLVLWGAVILGLIAYGIYLAWPR